MFLILVSCFSFSFSFFFLSKSTMIYSKLLLQPWWKREVPLALIMMPLKKRFSTDHTSSKVENVDENEKLCLLDLPELTLECILDRLSPSGLCSMGQVCSSLRDRCRSNHLWEKHMKQKWGRVIGDAAYKEWQCYIASRKSCGLLNQSKKKLGLLHTFLRNKVRVLSWIKPTFEGSNESPSDDSSFDSIMAWYVALESGKFLFPAQVFNRENGHVGFLLSCYDAKLRYNSATDTFQARYSPHGRQTTEDDIRWDRLRVAPVDTPQNVLHVSDCLNDLKPGDHMEIQWRRNKEFPYGWWYGVIGHMESCDGNENHCFCHSSDTVILEFKQYMIGSQWRRITIDRKNHREQGNEIDGFYGGIRKLYDNEEISTWKRLTPKQVLQ